MTTFLSRPDVFSDEFVTGFLHATLTMALTRTPAGSLAYHRQLMGIAAGPQRDALAELGLSLSPAHGEANES